MLRTILILSLSLAKVEFRLTHPSNVSGTQLSRVSLNKYFYFSGEEQLGISKKSITYLTQSNKQTFEFPFSPSSPVVPSPRSFYGGYYDTSKNMFFVIGGIGKFEINKDMWVYYVNFDYWAKVEILEYNIGGRFDFAINGFSDSDYVYMYIFGGKNETDILSDFYQITFDTRTVQARFGNLNHLFVPGFKLFGSQIQIIKPYVYIFSGCNITTNNSLNYFEDLIEYNSYSYKSRYYNLEKKLSPSAHGGSFAYGKMIYYYFGEYNNRDLNKIFSINTADVDGGWIELSYSSSSDDCSRSKFGFTKYYNTTSKLPKVYFFGGISEKAYMNTMGSIIINDTNAVIQCDQQAVSPELRNRGTLVQFSNSLLLFGGRNSETFFNNLWSVEYPEFEEWTLIEAFGEYPKPRINHAACSQANMMIIIGGYDQEMNILSDIFLLEKTHHSSNDSTYQWKQLTPSASSVIPPPVASTCAMLDYPYIYYIGGETVAGLSKDLWQFNLITSNFTKFRTPETFPNISMHGCYLQKNKSETYIYVFFGKVSEFSTPSSRIFKLNLTDSVLAESIILENITVDNITARFNFAYAVIGSSLIIAGGQAYNSYIFNDSWAVDLNNFGATGLGLNQSVYSSNFAKIAEKFYIFSGLSGSSLMISANSLSNITIYQKDNFTDEDCGRGFFYHNNSCFPCPEGFYKDDNDFECMPCNSGTYSNALAATSLIQCIPCPFGTFNRDLAKNECQKCSDDGICFVGSSSPISALSYFQTEQPDLVSPEFSYYFLILLVIVSGGIFLLFISLWLCFLRFKVFFSVFDIFSSNHVERPVDTKNKDDTNRSKYSDIGGIFTGLLLILSGSLIVYYIFLISAQNTNVTQNLIASNIISDKSGFKNEKISVYLGFNSLRHNSGDCSAIIPDVLNYRTISVENDKTYTYENSNGSFCAFKYNLEKSEIFDSGDSITISFDRVCQECYTSDIGVALESRGAYHNKKSRVYYSLVLTDNSVFQGKGASLFYFNLIPTYYEDYTDDNYEEKFGFRIADVLDPIPGTTSQNVFFNSGLSIEIQISLSQVGLHTVSENKMGLIEFFGILTGAISGFYGLVSMLMNIYETVYFKFKYRDIEVENLFKIEYERQTKTKIEKLDKGAI